MPSNIESQPNSEPEENERHSIYPDIKNMTDQEIEDKLRQYIFKIRGIKGSDKKDLLDFLEAEKFDLRHELLTRRLGALKKEKGFIHTSAPQEISDELDE